MSTTLPLVDAPASDLDAADREAADRALLSGPAAEHLLRAVLDAEGVRMTAWVLHQVQHRPGVGVTAGWTVRWERQDGPLRTEGQDYLLATTCPVPSGTAGATTAVLAGRDLTVWRHPQDPVLPGLPLATDRDAVARRLGQDPDGSVLELVTYRPLRRSVLRLRAAGGTTYLKVVRPHQADLLRRRHEDLLAAEVPVARCTDLGQGVLALTELRGRPLTDHLAADGAVDVDPRAVVAVLDDLPASLLAMPRRPAWADRLTQHADAAAAAVPQHAARIAALADRVAALLRTTDPGPVVPTHGDLHEANLLVEAGRVVGLLDVDSAGPGHRVDDVACLLGHLSVLPALAPDVHRHVPRALTRWTAVLEHGVDPVGLRARAAAVVLSLVAGARREDGGDRWRADATARVDAAERWLTDAERLRGLSSARQTGLIRRDDRGHDSTGGTPATRRTEEDT